jgi:hypothetical protein
MADITSNLQGNVSDEGQVNWRGDQVSVVQGGQSIYETSSVKLADLGSRKVVGDRVFRYALSADTIKAGEIASTTPPDAKHTNTHLATNAITGMKSISIVLTTSAAANYFADGYVHVQSGTAANIGYMYKVRSHGSVGDAGSGAFTLYDPISKTADTTDHITVTPSMYRGIIKNTDQANPPVGVAPVNVVSSDYFWLQTWGPCAVYAGSAGLATIGGALVAGSAGAAETSVGAACPIIGISLAVGTAAQACASYLTIAP